MKRCRQGDRQHYGSQRGARGPELAEEREAKARLEEARRRLEEEIGRLAELHVKEDPDAKGRFNRRYTLALWDVFGCLPVCIAHTQGGLSTFLRYSTSARRSFWFIALTASSEE